MSVELPVSVRSVAAARAILDQALDRHDSPTRRVTAPDVRANAVLLLSELVTNAVRHTRSLLQLEITLAGHSVHVAVIDDSPDLPTRRDPDSHATDGRGLHIVDTLADHWGVVHRGDRKSVWFEIALPDHL